MTYRITGTAAEVETRLARLREFPGVANVRPVYEDGKQVGVTVEVWL